MDEQFLTAALRNLAQRSAESDAQLRTDLALAHAQISGLQQENAELRKYLAELGDEHGSDNPAPEPGE